MNYEIEAEEDLPVGWGAPAPVATPAPTAAPVTTPAAAPVSAFEIEEETPLPATTLQTPNVQRSEQVMTSALQELPEVVVSAERPKQPPRRETSWREIPGDVSGEIGRRIENKITGVMEYTGGRRKLYGEMELWRAQNMARVADEAAQQGVALTAHPDVVKTAKELGVSPFNLVPTDWSRYANLTDEERGQEISDSIRKIQTGNKRRDEARTRRQRAAQVAELYMPHFDSQWSPKSLIFDAATSVPDLLLGVGAGMVNPVAGLAAMGGSIAPEMFTEGKNRGLSDRQALGYAALMTSSEVATELPLFEVLKQTPAGRRAIRAVAGKYADAVGGRILTATAIEGTGEAITEALQIGVEQGFFNEDITLGEALQQIARSGVIGGGMGATVASVTEGARAGAEAVTAPREVTKTPPRVEPVIETMPDGSPAQPGLAHEVATAPADRRQDEDTRKRVDQMSEEELRQALLTNELSGLPNRRAYEEAQKKPVQASIDIDSLKYVNDNLGHQAGDALLREAARVLREEGVEGFHISGDEFVVQGEDEASVRAALDRASERLRTSNLELPLEDGGKKVFSGMGLSYGTGSTLEEAEGKLQQAKAERERRGERAPRGEPPPGAIEVVEQPRRRKNVPRGEKAENDQGGTGAEAGAVPGVAAPGREGAPPRAPDATEAQTQPDPRVEDLRAVEAGTASPEQISRATSQKLITQSETGAPRLLPAGRRLLARATERPAETPTAKTLQGEGVGAPLDAAQRGVAVGGDSAPASDPSVGQAPPKFEATGSETQEDGTVIEYGAPPFKILKARSFQRPSGHQMEGAVEATVPLKDLHATQKTITRQGLEKPRDDSHGLPMVVRADGRLHIQDGHHRLAKQLYDGDTEARVRLVDLDAASGQRPVLSKKAGADPFPAEWEASNSNDLGEKIRSGLNHKRYQIFEKEGRVVPVMRTPGFVGLRKEMRADGWREVIPPEAYEILRRKEAGTSDQEFTVAGQKIRVNVSPTKEQRESGEYTKGRVKFAGFDINIENPRGTKRKYRSPDGKIGERTMQHHYGEFDGVPGADGDNVDVFLVSDKDTGRAFIINQIDPQTGEFDEVKVVLGAETEIEARDAYLSNYQKDWLGLGEMHEVSNDRLREWLGSRKSRSAYKPKMPMFSRASENPTLAQRIEAAIDGDAKGPIVIGNAPAALTALGIDAKPIVLPGPMAAKMFYDHGLTKTQIMHITEYLADPLMVFKSDTEGQNNWVILTRDRVPDGPLMISFREKGAFGQHELNVITSAYGRKEPASIGQWFKKGLLVASSRDEALRWVKDYGMDSPQARSSIGRAREISRPARTRRPLFSRAETPPNVAAFLDEYHKISLAHPLTAGDRMIGQGRNGADWAIVTLMRWDDGIHISAIQSLAQGERTGAGSYALKRIVELADKHHVRLYLEAKKFGTVKKSPSTANLRKWYQRYGFERARGADTMIRLPHSPQGRPLFSKKAPGFYSAVLREVEGSSLNKASAEQWWNTIKARPGVKPEELEWLGLESWLKSHKGAITREDVTEFIRANQISVSEVVYADGTAQSEEQRRMDQLNVSMSALGYEPHHTLDEPRLMRIADGEIINYDIVEKVWYDRNNDEWPVTDELEEMALAHFDLHNASLHAQHPVEQSSTKYDQYTLTGGKGYSELLLTLPEIPVDTTGWVAIPKDDLPGIGPLWLVRDKNGKWIGEVPRMKYPSKEAAIERAAQGRSNPANYKSSHWTPQNIVAHVRFKERIDTNGKRMLFVEEIQSDWHQAGRKRGYRKETFEAARARADELGKNLEQFVSPAFDALEKHGNFGFGGPSAAIAALARHDDWEKRWDTAGIPEEDMKPIRDYVEAKIAYRNAERHATKVSETVPEAPFKTSWTELAFKRVLRWAVENDFDSVGWTTGAQQDERYDLTNHLEKVRVVRADDGAKTVSLYLKRGGVMGVDVSVDGVIQASHTGDNTLVGHSLSELVGENLASQIMNTEDGYIDAGMMSFSDSGMSGYYDKILPRTVAKLTKKWGGKVSKADILPYKDGWIDGNQAMRLTGQTNWGELTLGEREDLVKRARATPVAVHSIDITPEMRKSIGEDGFPLFARNRGEDRDLIVTHNLSAENVLHVQRMGGIPVPSLSITRVDHPMEGFGEITLIGDAAMADPRGYARTRVFGADVYSPRYPSVEFVADAKAAKKITEVTGVHHYSGRVEIDNLTASDKFNKLAEEQGIPDRYDSRRAFAEKIIREAGATERIFRGYTDLGNRRYTPHTLENVVKILKKDLRGGEGFSYGVGNLRAMFTPQFRSLSQIREAKDLLVSKEKFEAVKKEIDSEFWAIANSLEQFHHASKNFGFGDIVIETLKDSARMGVRRALTENAFEAERIDDAIIQEINQFLAKLRHLPTEYFEAKILREVDLAEFKGAVVPSDTQQEVIDALTGRGLAIEKYDRQDQTARAAAVKRLAEKLGEDVVFSRRPARSFKDSAPMFDDVRDLAKRIMDDYGVNNIRVVGSIRSLPTKIQNWMQNNPGAIDDQTKGFLWPDSNELFIIAGQVDSIEDAANTIFHELVGHYGLRSMLGDQYEEVMRGIWRDMPAMARRYAVRNNLNLKDPEQYLAAAEEVVAYAAGNILTGGKPAQRELSAWQRVLDKVKEILSRLIGRPYYNEAQIARIVANASAHLKRRSFDQKLLPMSAGVRLSQKVPLYYQQLWKSIASEKVPERASPEEYLRILRSKIGLTEAELAENKRLTTLLKEESDPAQRKLLKSQIISSTGEIKPEEMRWSGLEAFLSGDSSRHKTMTFGSLVAAYYSSGLGSDAALRLLQEMGAPPRYIELVKKGHNEGHTVAESEEILQYTGMEVKRIPKSALLDFIENEQILIEVRAPRAEESDSLVDEILRADGVPEEMDDEYMEQYVEEQMKEAEEEIHKEALETLKEEWESLDDQYELTREDFIGAMADEKWEKYSKNGEWPNHVDIDDDTLQRIADEEYYSGTYNKRREREVNDYVNGWEPSSYTYEVLTEDDHEIKVISNFGSHDAYLDDRYIASFNTQTQAARAAVSAYHDKYPQEGVRWEGYVVPGGQKYGERLFIWKNPPAGFEFTHGHFSGERDFLAHVRYDIRKDRDGNDVLFLDEIQSDLMQELRKRGTETKEELEKKWEFEESRFAEAVELARSPAAIETVRNAIELGFKADPKTVITNLQDASVTTYRSFQDILSIAQKEIEKESGVHEPIFSWLEEVYAFNKEMGSQSDLSQWKENNPQRWRSVQEAEANILRVITPEFMMRGVREYAKNLSVESINGDSRSSHLIVGLRMIPPLSGHDQMEYRLMDMSSALRERHASAHAAFRRYEESNDSILPPLIDTWPLAVLKWAIREAAERGIRKIAIPPGTVHGARWNSTETAENLEASRLRDTEMRLVGHNNRVTSDVEPALAKKISDLVKDSAKGKTEEDILAFGKERGGFVNLVANGTSLITTMDRIPRIIGLRAGSILQKQLQSAGEDAYKTKDYTGSLRADPHSKIFWPMNPKTPYYFDIHAGQIEIYGNIYPRMFNKFLSRYGVKITAGSFEMSAKDFHSSDAEGLELAPDSRGAEFNGDFYRKVDVEVLMININDKLNDDALNVGFPLFSKKEAEGLKALGNSIVNGDSELLLPEPSPFSRAWNYLRYKVQDKFIDLLNTQREVQQFRGAVALPEKMDAYLQQTLYHGRAEERIAEFEKQFENPLIELIKNSGYQWQDVSDYLYARHAPERNKRIREINPDDPSWGSGMTDEVAAKVMEDLERRGNIDRLHAIGAKVDQITKWTRDVMVMEGLEKPETIAAWEQTYQHYVPLKGWANEEDAQTGPVMPRKGKGFDTGGKLTKAATGRKTLAGTILANIGAQARATLVLAEKAKAGRALYDFVRANPAPDYWSVDEIQYTRTIDPSTGLVREGVNPMFKLADNVVRVKIDGEDKHITFNPNDERMTRLAAAMKNLSPDQIGPILAVLHGFNRYLSTISTSLNPEFVITNALRDLQTALINLTEEEVSSIRTKVVRDWRKAARGIWLAERESGKPHEWSDHWDRFKKAGAKVGWIENYKSPLDLEKAMQRKLGPANKIQWTMDKVRAVGEFVNSMNASVENAIRLSTFVNLVEAGVNEERAAATAKDLTVNFNRRGDTTVFINSLYLFANASIQGTARFARFAVSPKGRKVMAMIVAAGIGLDLLNRFIGGDDEDGENRYDKIPESEKERNIIVMLPREFTISVPGTEVAMDVGYLKIPTPYGYNVPYYMGSLLGKYLDFGFIGNRRAVSPGADAGSLMGAIMGSYSPLGDTTSIGQFISPTMTDPFVQLDENRAWHGGKIYPDAPFDESPPPDSQQAFGSTPIAYKKLATYLNTLTGGTEVTPGGVDVSPETMQHWVDFAGGGLMRFITSAINAPIEAVLDPQDLEAREVAFLRRVVGTVGQREDQELFYSHVKEIQYAKSEIDAVYKLGIQTQEGQERMAFIARKYPVATMLAREMYPSYASGRGAEDLDKSTILRRLYQGIQPGRPITSPAPPRRGESASLVTRLSRARQEIRRLEARTGLPAAERRKLIEEQRSEIERIVTEFNKRWSEVHDAVYGAKGGRLIGQLGPLIDGKPRREQVAALRKSGLAATADLLASLPATPDKRAMEYFAVEAARS